jgi:transposase
MRVVVSAEAGAAERAWELAKYGTPDERIQRIDRLEEEVERLERDNEGLRQRLRKLEEHLEGARRAGKRQAAPFSKGPSAGTGRPPGRQAGEAYGTKAHRPVPPHIDRSVEALLPASCPACGGAIQDERIAEQYQEELPPVQPVVTRFRVHIGRCSQCGRAVQGRHPEQTSDALGAAGVQLGPRAEALAVQLNKTVGASMAKTAAVVQQVGGIAVTAGGISQVLDRVGRRATPTYEALLEAIRHSPVVAPDETGWKVGGQLQWLWAFVGDKVTVYRIQAGRGFGEAASVLGKSFAGVLERDGWAPYRQFTQATHQTCTAHLLRRCHDLLETARGGARCFPLAVKHLLQEAVELRTRRTAGQMPPVELDAAIQALEDRADALLAEHIQQPDNRRLQKHLTNERQALFTHLKHDGVEATNWRAEQAIRPAVVNRKVWGGNRTPNGAQTQQVLVSLLRTCWQQARDPTSVLVALLRSPTPAVAPFDLPRG